MSADAARDRILSLTAKMPAPTRAQGQRRALVIYTVAVLSMAIVFQAAGGVAHSSGRPFGYTLFIAAGATTLAIIASLGAFGRGGTMGGRSRQALVAMAFAVPLVTLGWLVAWNGQYTEPFARIGYRCLALTVVLGGALLGAATLIRRRTVAATPTASGAAFGAAAGAWAGVGVDLWCPLTNAMHAGIGHVAPMFLLVGIGALLGHFVLRVRAH